MFIGLLSHYETAAALLEALRDEGHTVLPSSSSLYEWRSHGAYSEDDAAESLSKAVSKAKLASAAFDRRVNGRVLLLLGLGAKGDNNLIKAAGRQMQQAKEFKHDQKVQGLMLSTGWAQSAKKRWNLVPRKGDKMKQGKVPGPDLIDANQKLYQK